MSLVVFTFCASNFDVTEKTTRSSNCWAIATIAIVVNVNDSRLSQWIERECVKSDFHLMTPNTRFDLPTNGDCIYGFNLNDKSTFYFRFWSVKTVWIKSDTSVWSSVGCCVKSIKIEVETTLRLIKPSFTISAQTKKCTGKKKTEITSAIWS